MINDKPISDDELIKQFKISHLAPRHRKQAIETFMKYKGAFSRHDYDLGKATDIEMDIELIPNPKKKPKLQKILRICLRSFVNPHPGSYEGTVRSNTTVQSKLS